LELSEADLIVFPYQETGESSSAAVRYGIASGTPVAVTPLNIFDDVSPAVFKLPGTTPLEMAAGMETIITEILNSTESVKYKEEVMQQWSHTHIYSTLSERLYRMLTVFPEK